MAYQSIDTWMSLWRRLTPLYDEGEAKAVVRMVLESKFGMSTADIYTDGIAKLTDKARRELEGSRTRAICLGVCRLPGASVCRR